MSDETQMDAVELPDGSGVMTMSLPLPADHWLYRKDAHGRVPRPPMGLRCGKLGGFQDEISYVAQDVLRREDLFREVLSAHVANAVKYGIKCATRNGEEKDFDPDCIVQQTIVGLFGFHTDTGLKGLWDGAMSLPPGLTAVLNRLSSGLKEIPAQYCGEEQWKEPSNVQ